MWPAAAGSVLALMLAVELPGEPAISMERAMAWSMIAHLEFAFAETEAGRLADAELLDSTGTPFGSGAKWKSLFAAIDEKKYILAWLDNFDEVAAIYERLPEALADFIRRGSKTRGLWFSGVYHSGDGLEPKVGATRIPALPFEVPNGTPVAGIILP